MKILKILALAVGLFGCGGTGVELKGSLDDGYAPGERRSLSYPFNIPMREGVTQAGGAYQILQNGDVRFWGQNNKTNSTALWRSQCKVDPINDEKNCFYYSGSLPGLHNPEKGRVIAEHSKSGDLTGLCIIGHDFPGRTGSIRVDGNQAISTGVDGCISGQKVKTLQQQLLNGQKLTLRRYEWPYDYPVDSIDNGESFKEIYALTKFANANIARLF